MGGCYKFSIEEGDRLPFFDPYTIDFDAPDGEPVDLVIGLMVPAEVDETHHADIRMIARVLDDVGLRGRLRGASSSSELYESLLHRGSLTNPDTEASAQGGRG